MNTKDHFNALKLLTSTIFTALFSVLVFIGGFTALAFGVVYFPHVFLGLGIAGLIVLCYMECLQDVVSLRKEKEYDEWVDKVLNPKKEDEDFDAEFDAVMRLYDLPITKKED